MAWSSLVHFFFYSFVLLSAFVSAKNDKLDTQNPLEVDGALSFMAGKQHSLNNATFVSLLPALHPWYGREATLVPSGSPNILVKIFKRACDLNCGGDAICCNNPATAGHSYCCANTRVCGPGTSSNYCSYIETTVTDYKTTTVYKTVTSSHQVSSAATTKWTTVVSTSVVVTTISGLNTFTQTEWVTVTEPSNERREVPTTVAPCNKVALSTPTPTAAADAFELDQKPLIPEITEAAQLHLRGLWRRQLLTWTNTVTVTNTITDTVSVDVTSVQYYTVTSTTTSVFRSTFTSAINAKTTVFVTSTFTQQAGQPDQNNPAADPTDVVAANNGNTNDNTPNNAEANSSGSSLTKGAQIGIGVGSASGSLLICILLIFYFRRRRASKKAKTEALIDQAVAAATAAQNEKSHPQSPSDAKYPATNTAPYSPPYASSPSVSIGTHSPPPRGSQRYSDPRQSPQLVTGYELSATPGLGQQTYYPPPPDPGRIQTPAEMYYPVPQEVSAVYSPRPGPVYPHQQQGRY